MTREPWMDAVDAEALSARILADYRLAISGSEILVCGSLDALAEYIEQRLTGTEPATFGEERSWNLSPDNSVLLRDHVVAGQYVFPTDGFIELLAQCVASETSAVMIERLHLAEPFVVATSESRTLRLSLSQQNHRLRFRFFSQDGVTITTHADGMLALETPSSRRTSRHWAILDGAKYQISADRIYQTGESRFGPFYQTIREMRFLDTAAAAVLRRAPEDVDSSSAWRTAPSLVDASIVTALALAKSLRPTSSCKTLLPALLEGIHLGEGIDAREATVLVELLESDCDGSVFSFSLIDEDNRVIMSCDRFHAREVVMSRERSHDQSLNRWQCEEHGVAIVGVSCRFPGADNLEEYWNNIREGRDAIGRVPKERWDAEAVYDPDPRTANRTYSQVGGFLRNVDHFDAMFFGIAPTEAAVLDPQQRLFLTECWKALEDAGYSEQRLSGLSCGVFAGASPGDYMHMLDASNANSSEAFTGLAASILASRVSYYLNLTGPSLSIDTACSSSLVAVRNAILSIESGDCDVALAGGVALLLSPDLHIKACKTGMLSQKGACRSFDASADGIVLGEGVGVVVLKPIAAARRDRDRIYAVIVGSGSNQDGKTNGITAPSGPAQRGLLETVMKRAGVEPRQVGLIEAHGTGTPLGDAVELEALLSTFPAAEDGLPYCTLSSVKSQIGHTTLAAGVASLIKATLCLHYRTLPPTLHYSRPLELKSLAATPFRIDGQSRAWQSDSQRFAGVSSFGFSGTNCHVLLSEAYPQTVHRSEREYEVLALSAKTAKALQNKIDELLLWSQQRGEQHSLYSVASMLARGRSHFKHRAAIVCRDWTDLLDQLRSYHNGFPVPSSAGQSIRDAASQYLQGSEQLLYDFYPLDHHQVISMPAYPFAQKGYWVSRSADRSQSPPQPLAPSFTRRSTPEGECISFDLMGNEAFVSDHIVSGRKVLAAACILELVHIAARAVFQLPITSFLQLSWLVPVDIGPGGIRLDVYVRTVKPHYADFSVSSAKDDGQSHFCTGSLTTTAQNGSFAPLNIQDLLTQTTRSLSGKHFYQYSTDRGLQLGRTFQTLDEIHYGQDFRLGQLTSYSQPSGFAPGILDGALQTALAETDAATGCLRIPLSVTEIRVHGPLPTSGWAYARRSPTSATHFDVSLSDSHGNVALEFVNFEARSLSTSSGQASEVIFANPSWIEMPTPYFDGTAQNILVFTDSANPPSFGAADCIVIVRSGHEFERTGPSEWTINSFSLDHYDRLFAVLNEAGRLPDVILHDSHGRSSQPSFEIFAMTQGWLRSVLRRRCRIVHRSDGSPESAAVVGLARSVGQETERVTIRVVEHASSEEIRSELGDLSAGPGFARYFNGQRQIQIYEERELPAGSFSFRRGGCYLLTGGSGAIAQLLAHRLVQDWDAKVVLLSRSRPASTCPGTEWQPTDITDPSSVRRSISVVRQQLGPIHGVFHLAGSRCDSTLLNKTYADFAAVFGAKVDGLILLDEELAAEQLDFFFVFSSIASALGNFGQSDYAAANAYLDGWAYQRNNQVTCGTRYGITRTVNWPLWAEGGMRANSASDEYARRLGLQPMPTDIGWKVTCAALAQERCESMVLFGDAAKLRKLLQSHLTPARPRGSISCAAKDALERVCQELSSAACSVLKIDLDEFDSSANLGDYGFHSINIAALANEIHGLYGIEIPPSTLFEYPTIVGLATYLTESYSIGVAVSVDSSTLATEDKPEPARTAPGSRNEPIAIVGFGVRMPQSGHAEDFFSMLRDGRHAITEIPSDRWNWREYQGEATDGANTTNVRWGAFLRDVGHFDPYFFGISPKEAACMDPQQRIALECAWEAIEGAGIAPEQLAGSNVGVFVGVSTSDYGDLMRDTADGVATHGSTGVSHCILANRISYLLDIHGPSEPVDTACSSALVALHRAVQSIRSGQCTAALAGGVNIILSPMLHIAFAQAGMLSPDGICRPFSDGANGYVRGEGAGIFLLKPLSSAIRDGNPIHAVIRGSAVNHGGRATSLTAPNPSAQVSLLLDAWADAGISPFDLQLIEAHGTATPLGDPIEVNALQKARRQWAAAHPSSVFSADPCRVGSVKGNIGHLEAAAGAAGLLKILLAMRHRWIPRSLHTEHLNPQIQGDDSSLRIAQQGEPWHQRVDTQGKPVPRLAAVSSFGFGGANAHLIVEEYERVEYDRTALSSNPQWIVLSAKDDRRLRATAAALAASLEHQSASLSAVAFTLQVGRNAWPERLAFQASDLPSAVLTLRSIAGGLPTANVFRGSVSKRPSQSPESDSLGESWVHGHPVDWSRWMGSPTPQRIHLPSSAYLRQRCWFAEAEPLASDKHHTPDNLQCLRRVWQETENATSVRAIGTLAVLGGTPEEVSALRASAPDVVTHYDRSVDAVIYLNPDLFGWRSLATKAATQPGRAIRWLLVQHDPNVNPEFESLCGIGRALLTASPQSAFVALRLPGDGTPSALARVCTHELERLAPGGFQDVLRQGPDLTRYARQLIPAVPGNSRYRYRKGGLYLITGGLGSLGLALARRITSNGGNVVLVGRTPSSSSSESLLAGFGGNATYHSVDITNRQAVRDFVAAITSRCPLRGVIHAAGSRGHSALARKPDSEWSSVLRPKLDGTIILDSETSNQPLDFFVAYSSIAGHLGDLGQGDYAAASLYLDAYCEERASRGPGRSLSVGWSLWAGTPAADRNVQRQWEEGTGLKALQTESALDMLERLLETDFSSVAVVAGDAVSLVGTVRATTYTPSVVSANNTHDARTQLEDHLIRTVSKRLQLAEGQLKAQSHLTDFGLDSILLNQFLTEVAAQFGEVPKSLLLEEDTVQNLARYIFAHYEQRVTKHLRPSQQSTPSCQSQAAPATEPIAVVGLAGRFPGASSLNDFWGQLLSVKSAVGPIPCDRWQQSSDGRTPRIGAFLDDVRSFDPLFFGITLQEAAGMKPEERILLQVAYEALETAGYPIPSHLSPSTAVYMGVTANTYPLFVKDMATPHASMDTSVFGLANRISHCLQCEGPSLTLDTGCSSAISAVHLASEALRSGSAKMALAGAVNLILHPSKYELLEHSGLAASQPQGGLFPAGGKGFVPGEGAGVLVLKTLTQAIRDRDNIWGLLEGTLVSHKGGRLNYRLPSPLAAKDHLNLLLATAGIDASAISYVEAQALGAELADSSEWSALASVLGQGETPCYVGSAKLSIGHLEAASGIAQIIKVLLQLRHDLITPSPLADPANSDVIVARTRLSVSEKPVPWISGTEPRRALVTSAGIGGSLASVLVREPPAPNQVTDESTGPRPYLIVLSAKTADQLTTRIAALRSFLASPDHNPSLADVAYTLQCGRSHYRHRWALLAQDLGEVISLATKSWSSRASDAMPTVKLNSWEDVAQYWVAGGEIPLEWQATGRRIPLPTYPFEQVRCWVGESSGLPSRRATTSEPIGVVATYYNRVTESLAADIGDRDVHLVFAPFTAKISGFSWLMTFFDPENRSEHYSQMLAAQRQLKRLLTRQLDWSQTHRLLDIGCGLATDLIELAKAHPTLEGVGFTITPKQAELGQARVHAAGLRDRVAIYHCDSARDPFPGVFDGALGFEVLFHVQDKDALLSNLASHLKPGGYFVVADCLTNTVTDIKQDSVGLYTMRAPQMARTMADTGFEIVSCIDVSQEMSNFLDDDSFEENLKTVRRRFPELAQAEAEHRAWHNCGKAFSLGLIRYVLFTARRDPLTPSEELERRNSQILANPTTYAVAVGEMERQDLVPARNEETQGLFVKEVHTIVAELIGVTPQRLEADVPLAEYGVDSLVGLKLIDTLNRRFHLELEMQTLFDCPTVLGLGAAVAAKTATLEPTLVMTQSRDESQPVDSFPPDAIAVVGMAGRFPGATDVDEFWQNLRQGVDSVGVIPADRWKLEGFYDPDPNKPDRSYSRWGGFLRGVDEFDAEFFRITRAEAEVMDPQQRLFLETCWSALENAGYAGPGLKGSSCGVIAGVFNNDYQMLLARDSTGRNLGHAMLGNAESILAARISYFLDLKGPALCVDSACSSSLVAVHLACQSLRNGEAQMMLAGGITLYLDEHSYLMMSKAGMLSPTGRCRSFSDGADGITTGEAVGVVVLKRMTDAVADRDTIYGVIRGSGINQDGQTNGITAPSREAQKALLRSIYQRTGINPRTIDYVEAHGTGTKLGDPVEFAALAEVFREYTSEVGFCRLGSVKSNIGHTSAAAGVSGLIKVLQSMRHRMIPPTLHAEVPNPLLALEQSPFQIAGEACAWNGAQRAAVSAFGFSGTNCHLIVDGPPPLPALEPDVASWVRLSAGSPQQLREYATKVRVWLSRVQTERICDVAWTLDARPRLPHAIQFYVSGIPQLIGHLGDFLAGATTDIAERPIEPLRPKDVRRIPVPGPPFQRQRYWFQGGGGTRGKALESTDPQPSGIIMSVDSEVLLREHTIHGRPCLPTDVLLDFVYRDSVSAFGQVPIHIRDVSLYSPAFCDPGTSLLIKVGSTGTSIRETYVESAALGDKNTRRHLTATVERAVETTFRTSAPLPLAVVEIDGSLLYDTNQVIQVGPFYRSLRRISVSGERAQAKLCLSDAAKTDSRPFGLHPGVFDGFFGVANILALRNTPAPNTAYLPFCIRDVVVLQALTDVAYSADIQLVHTGPGYLRFDGDLIDESGEIVLAIRGLDMRQTPSESLRLESPHLPAVTAGPLSIPCTAKLQLKPLVPGHNEPQSPTPLANLSNVSPPSAECIVPGAVAITVERLSQTLAKVLLCDASSLNPAASFIEQGVDSILGLEFVQQLNRDFGLRLQGTILFEHPTLNALAGQLAAPSFALSVASPENPLRSELIHLFAQTLLIEPSTIRTDITFTELGADSILGLEFVQKVNRRYGLRLPGTVLFEYPTIDQLSGLLASACDPEPKRQHSPMTVQPISLALTRQSGEDRDPIAIIGMAGRFPGANTVDELWAHLERNSYLIEEVPLDHWDSRPYQRSQNEDSPLYCNRGAFVSGVDQFDPLFFHISPREAETMDPQLRLLLEVLWETLEDSGHAGRIKGTRTGLYLGNCYNDYLDLMKQSATIDFQFAGSGNSNSMLSNRASFYFDLTGPCLTLDTACSSSLVAVHLAAQALRRDECEMAIAAGVNLNLSSAKYLNFCALGAFSRSGEIRPFSAHADGYLPGEAVASLLLKPMSAAVRDGDRIHGLILGSAVRSGGRSPGPTVPNPAIQTATMIDAWRDAGIDASTLSYLEAHGTGTKLGDPLEINAIRRALGSSKQPCFVGTIKSNIGHTEATAGIAGIIKVLLQMRHRKITGMPNLLPLNPMIDPESSPIILSDRTRDWRSADGSPLRAGVNSFGMGGTYAHAVLQEPPLQVLQPSLTHTPVSYKLMVSARTKEAVRTSALRLADYLDANPTISLADVAFTLHHGREHMEERVVIVASSLKEAARKLREAPAEVPSPETNEASLQGRIVTLPTYPFEHQAYWFQPRTAQPARASTSVTKRYILEPSNPIIAGHRVNGETYLPATDSIWKLLRESQELGNQVQIDELVWRSPIRIRSQSLSSLLSIEESGTGWDATVSGDHVHATARLSIESTPPRLVPPIDLAAWQNEATRTSSSGDLYLAFREVGLEYGTEFRNLEVVWSSAMFALGRWSAEANTPEPAILDSGLQTISALLGTSLTPYLPFSAKDVRLLGPLSVPRSGWTLVRRHGVDTFEVLFADSTGNPFLQIGEIAVRPQPAKDLRGQGWYSVEWEQSPLPDLAPPIPKPTLVLCTDRLGKVAQQFLKTSYLGVRAPFPIPSSEAAIRSAIARTTNLSEVWFIADVESPQPGHYAQELTLSLYRLIRSLVAMGFHHAPLTLRVVTNRTLAVSQGDEVVPDAAGLRGLSRSAANEFPRWSIVCIDCDESIDSAQCLAIAAVEPPIQVGHDVAYRQGVRWTRRLKPMISIGESGHLALSDHGVYLVAGGGHGIGLEFSRWLTGRTRPRLVWLGRRPMDAAIWDRIGELESRGAEVLYVRADLGDRASLERGLRIARDHFGPIEGVVHSAMVLRDGLLSTQDEDSFRAALDPKMSGLQNLRDELASDPLNFALLFSSVQSLLGNAGQANYSSGCTFADAFAQAWNAGASYPVKVINWSYWGSVGAVATLEYRARMEAAGVHSLEPEDGMRAVEAILGSPNLDQLWVVKAEPRFLRLLGLAADPAAEHKKSEPSQLPSFLQRSLSILEQAR